VEKWSIAVLAEIIPIWVFLSAVFTTDHIITRFL
jgi:hypothetical protein